MKQISDERSSACGGWREVRSMGASGDALADDAPNNLSHGAASSSQAWEQCDLLPGPNVHRWATWGLS